MPQDPLPLLQGTLDLLVLRCLSGGARHGYAIASMVREQTGGDLSVEDAALYQSLHRLHRQDLRGCGVGAVRKQPPRALLHADQRPAARACGKRPRTGAATRAPSTRCCKGPERWRDQPRFWYLRRRSVAVRVDEELSAASRDAGRRARSRRACRADEARREALRQFGDLEATRRYCREQDETREKAMQRTLMIQDFIAGPAHRHSQPAARADADADDHRHGRRRHRRHRGDLQRHQCRDAAAAALRGIRIAWCAFTPTRRRSSSGSRSPTTWPSPSSRRDSNNHATYTDRAVSFSNGEIAELLRTRVVSWAFFSVLGINPMIGRDFTEADGRAGTSASRAGEPRVLAAAAWRARGCDRQADPARRRRLHAWSA